MNQRRTTRTIHRTWKHRLQAGNLPLGALLIVAGLSSLALLMWEGAGQSIAHHIPNASSIPKLDKLLHFAAHGAITFLLFWGGVLSTRLPDETKLLRRIAIVMLLADFAAGLLIEWVQLEYGYTAGRQFSWNDIISNSLGAFFAIVLSLSIAAWLLRPYKGKFDPEQHV